MIKALFFFFYLNTCSLEHLVQSTKTDFDIISVSESRLIKDKLPLIDTSLPNFHYEIFSAEANPSGTFIHIKKLISGKLISGG